jgi:hypothetical protein
MESAVSSTLTPTIENTVATPSFITEQTTGSLIRNTFRLYFQHFLKLEAIVFVTQGVPVFVYYLASIADASTSVLPATAVALQLLALVPAFTAISLAVSHAGFSGHVSVRTALRRAFAIVTWRVYATVFLYIVIVIVGAILLIVPGVVFMVWFQFAPLISVLEAKAPRESLRRSRLLGKGLYLRNFGVIFLTTLSIMVPYYILIFSAVIISLLATGGEVGFVAVLLPTIATLLGLPLIYIATVLLYWDLRVRKEAGDTWKQLEELRL